MHIYTLSQGHLIGVIEIVYNSALLVRLRIGGSKRNDVFTGTGKYIQFDLLLSAEVFY